MSGSNGKSHYARARYEVPDVFRKWKSRYDFDSEELQNLQQQNIKESQTQVFDLTVAQPPTNPLQLNITGRAFRLRGIDSTQVYNFTTNAGVEGVKTAAIVGVWIGKVGGPGDALMLKHGDGFRGDFSSLFFFWPSQSGINMRFTAFMFDDMPWVAGDPST